MPPPEFRVGRRVCTKHHPDPTNPHYNQTGTILSLFANCCHIHFDSPIRGYHTWTMVYRWLEVVDLTPEEQNQQQREAYADRYL